ncbi:hypothetical protein PC118_g23134 [Phytophthora cactorum]|uniref:Necrosis inducing protein n=1 Tax=Phytophthora cactorum TaxID=29920 RepID=A0A8T1ERD2_9STRA|nr:hypothetical protein PC118_g23134 [Phytophthora cactorum]
MTFPVLNLSLPITTPDWPFTTNLRVIVATSVALLTLLLSTTTVVPFAQPTPSTTLQTLAAQFKSQIYPARISRTIFLDHSLSATSTAGETQDLIMWDQLTDAARMPLDFGDANVPFKDANFETKLGNNLLTLCITYVAR